MELLSLLVALSMEVGWSLLQLFDFERVELEPH